MAPDGRWSTGQREQTPTASYLKWKESTTVGKRIKSGLTLLKLRGLLPLRFGFGGAACPRQSGGKPPVSFAIGWVARNCFLVALDSVGDLVLLKAHAAGVGGKGCTLPIDSPASKFSGLLTLRGGFCGAALLSKNARERAVRSRLIWHCYDCLLERSGRFVQLVLLFVDTTENGPAITVLRAQPEGDPDWLPECEPGADIWRLQNASFDGSPMP